MANRIVVIAEVRGEIGPPAGDPPTVNPRGRSTRIEIRDSDGDASALEALLSSGIHYENEASFLTETTFSERGTILVGDGDGSLTFTTEGTGYVQPTPDPGLVNGVVIWRIQSGDGAFAGASGFITSNFFISVAEQTFHEHFIATIFVP